MTADHHTAPTVITLCPDGPMLVRGPISIIGDDGQPMSPHRTTIALCRCGKTSIAPFCDGTHKLLHRRADDGTVSRPVDREPVVEPSASRGAGT